MRMLAQVTLAMIVLSLAFCPPEASAGVITITLTESSGVLVTQNPGVEYVGTLDVPTFAPTPNSMFAVEAFSIALPDETGSDVTFSDTESFVLDLNQIDVDPFVLTDVNGDPSQLIGVTTGGSHPTFFVTNPISLATPITEQRVDYSIGFNNLSNPNVRFWSLNPIILEVSGPPLIAGDIFRSGFYELTAESSSTVPEPSSMTLLGIGLAGTAIGAWRRRRNGAKPAAT